MERTKIKNELSPINGQSDSACVCVCVRRAEHDWQIVLWCAGANGARNSQTQNARYR